ncbi:uncharacterized protein [Littorina saxatilis]|uniref:uncharacterized protein n=1 Tax=Littorina saxatilis TaxID=31220 RepID=UPI0038B610B8
MRTHLRQNELFVFVLTIGLSCAVTPTTCVAPSCVVGESTYVRCYFHKDINITKDEILVKHYAVGASEKDGGNDALHCYWRIDSDQPTCTAENGYQFNGNITDRLTLVLSATKEKEGRYACYTIPPYDTVVHECDLTVRERPEHASTTGITSTDATPTNDDNAEFYTTKEDNCGISATLNIVLGSILAVLVIIMGCLCIRWIHQVFYANKMHAEECAEPMLQTSKQSWHARVILETREASSQTVDVVELVDKSMFALHYPDQSPRVESKRITAGNILDNSSLCECTAESNAQFKPYNYKSHSVNDTSTGNASLRRRTISHPPLQKDPSEKASEQVDSSLILESNELEEGKHTQTTRVVNDASE